jgi:hypothetical protein
VKGKGYGRFRGRTKIRHFPNGKCQSEQLKQMKWTAYGCRAHTEKGKIGAYIDQIGVGVPRVIDESGDK